MRTTVRDVMTTPVISVTGSTPFKEIAARLSEHGVSALPVVDAAGRVMGVVSEADLMLKEEIRSSAGGRRLHGLRRGGDRKRVQGLVASELMSAPAITSTPEASVAEAARMMAKHHVKRLPVVDEAGRLVGIVSRRDVIGLFLRPDEDLLDEVVHRVIERTLWIDPRTVRVHVHDGVVTLEGEVETRSLVSLITELVRDVDGVVGVDSRLSFLVDDTKFHAEGPLPWGVLPYGLRGA